jgi:hypothetical protein
MHAIHVLANSIFRSTSADLLVCDQTNLQVVVSAECLAAHRAGEERGAKEDLSWGRDPIVSLGKLPDGEVLQAAAVTSSTPF